MMQAPDPQLTGYADLDPESVDLATFVAMAVHNAMAKMVDPDEAVAAIMERIERDRQAPSPSSEV